MKKRLYKKLSKREYKHSYLAYYKDLVEQSVYRRIYISYQNTYNWMCTLSKKEVRIMNKLKAHYQNIVRNLYSRQYSPLYGGRYE